MAHDRQLAENSSEQSEASKQSKTLSDIVADWLTLYAQAYREEITEEMALLYREALKEIDPQILHRAFLRAAKKHRFRPTPAEILDAAEIEKLLAPKPKMAYPEISQEEREAAMEDTKEARDKLRKQLGLTA